MASVLDTVAAAGMLYDLHIVAVESRVILISSRWFIYLERFLKHGRKGILNYLTVAEEFDDKNCET